MSNLLFNIRFHKWHWQLDRDWNARIAVNPGYVRYDSNNGEKWPLFKVHTLFGYHFR